LRIVLTALAVHLSLDSNYPAGDQLSISAILQFSRDAIHASSQELSLPPIYEIWCSFNARRRN